MIPETPATAADDYAIFDHAPVTATGRNLADHGAWLDDPHGAKLYAAILAIEAEAVAPWRLGAEVARHALDPNRGLIRTDEIVHAYNVLRALLAPEGSE